jgi:hypothetical protein
MKKILLLLISSFVLFSCNQNSEQTTQQEEEEEHQHHNHAESEGLELNHGEKWVVNDEMKPFVLKSEEIVNSYIASNSSDHQNLAAQLKEQNAGLIKSCTMQGKSHDELHKWLHPYIDLLNKLSKAETKEEAEHLIAEINESFKTYHAYFQ